MSDEQLGYSAQELASGPFRDYFNPEIKPVQKQVADALQVGGQATELFPPVSEAYRMTNAGYWAIETGFSHGSDGSLNVFCLTDMPGVSPQMWDWWFGWHGCEARRYKLWHPKAHISAQWADGRKDETYIGRTSLISEYLGSQKKKAAISFIEPSVMGLDETKLTRQGEVAICARIGLPGTPLKAGWLLHHLRPVDDGCEMRSRMWMGGKNVAFGSRPNPISPVLQVLLRPFSGALLPDANEMLIHNAQEMAHLAGFLPKLYAEFGPIMKGGENEAS